MFFSTGSGMVWWTRIVLNNLSPIIGVVWAYSSAISTESVVWEGVPVGFFTFLVIHQFQTTVYSPVRPSSTNGAVIFIHGGGFALGNVAMYDSLTRRMAYM